MSRFVWNCLLSTCSKPGTALAGGDRAEQHVDSWPFGSAQSNGSQHENNADSEVHTGGHYLI